MLRTGFGSRWRPTCWRYGVDFTAVGSRAKKKNPKKSEPIDYCCRDPNFARSLLGDPVSDCPQTKRAAAFAPICTHLSKKNHLKQPTNHLLHTHVQCAKRRRNNKRLDFSDAHPSFARSFLGDPGSDCLQTKRATACAPTNTHLPKKKQLKRPTNHLHTEEIIYRQKSEDRRLD